MLAVKLNFLDDTPPLFVVEIPGSDAARAVLKFKQGS